MADLPTGTVTLLFTDIEGSTRLVEELGDQYADLLADHQRALREAFQGHGGVEVNTQGDALFYAFARARDAVAAAQVGQSALAGGRVRVRMGVHTGEPRVTGHDYVGPDVHRAARVMGAAHGGQVLISQTTRELLDSEVELRDLGEHRLKDISAPLRLFQLGAGDFPPVRSLSVAHLPARLDPLLGRKRELAELVRLFTRDGARLVTLTGPGGIGKSRLSLAAAGELVESFDDGATLVELAAIKDPALVLPAIAGALGLQGDIAAHVGARELLVVLDNFEQVVDAAEELGRLLQACPGLRVLATSREPLRIAGEREFPLQTLAEAPAVELFRQRAEAVKPDFDGAYHAVAEICRRLDSLPLAIELAAARVKVLSTDRLLERLDRRLPILTGTRRDLPERQRTLRAAIAWSYDLLSSDEQSLFRHLSVFAGGWTLEAAETVCGAEVEVLESLIDKSLVRGEDERFLMLETIREYAADKLAESQEQEELRRRHAEFFATLAEEAQTEHLGAGQAGWRERFRAEWDNFRAVFEWAQESGEAELGLRLAASISFVWLDQNLIAEGERWFAALLRIETVNEAIRARALFTWSMIVLVRNDWPRAQELGGAALDYFRRAGDRNGIAWSLTNLASVPIEAGSPQDALPLLDEAETLHRELGDAGGLRRTLHLKGQTLAATGEIEEGVAMLQESAELSQRTDDHFSVASSRHALGDIALGEGEVDSAAAEYAEALRVAWETGAHRIVCYSLAGLAAVAAERGDLEAAALLWGFVERYEERLTFTLRRRALYAKRLEPAAKSHRDRWEAGRNLDVGAAVGYALSLEDR
jgi:predicted ATPase